ncbi:MAG TPA: MHYT domain-containing protein [Rhizomicrobium sp.]|jgi:signal transduction histidine kinase
MLQVLGCITTQHDFRFVVLAGILCLFACLTAMSLIARARATEGRMRHLWLAGAGVVAGCGIWGTHFVAMLAYRAGLPVAYDPWLTTLSVLIAASLCGVGFAVAMTRAGPAIGGAITGAAIGAMHYVGMAAVRVPAHAVWNLGYVAASVIIGVSLTAAALYIGFRQPKMSGYVTGATLFTLGIVGMHFTAMTAVVYIPDPAVAIPDVVLDPAALAIAVAAVAALIVGLGLAGALVDRHLALRAQSDNERLRVHVAELEATKAELELRSSELQAALEAAACASQAKSQFLATMSHELRTPLNAVIGFSEMLVTETFGPLGNPRYREYAGDIRASGAHLLSLINDVLDLSRLDAGQADLRDDDIDVATLIDQTVRMVRGQADAAKLKLSMRLEPNLPRLRADNRRVRQVLLNLLSNAIKFTPGKGRVEISAALQGEELAIVVADTGIGIAKQDIPRALSRFGQIDSSLSRKYEGAGLGLPLSKQLVELHGGRLVLESEMNVGTTVAVVFPVQRLVAVELRAFA